MRHIISLLLENEPGALSRVVGLFSARGYNIESLAVAPTHEPSVSRLTLVTRGNDEVIEQITKQLNKLIEVIKLADLTKGAHLERELLLMKVRADTAEQRNEYSQLVTIFRGHILDISDNTYTIELTGASDKITAFIQSINPAHLLEVVRSGVSGIARGSRSLQI